MNKTLFIIVALLCLASALPVKATTIGTANANLTFNLVTQDVGGVKYTPECLFECHLPINFSYGGSLTPNSRLINLNNMTWVKNKIEGLDNLQNVSVLYAVNQTYTDWFSNISCAYNDLGNGTILPNCTDLGTWLTKWRWVWLPLTSSLNISKYQNYFVDFVGTRTPSVNKSSIDIVPTVLGYPLTTLAWWNSSWIYCINYTFDHTKLSADLNNFPAYIHLNGNIMNATTTQASGQDFRVVDQPCLTGGNELAHEIEWWNNTGSKDIWFKVNLSSSVDTVVSFYFNNSGATDDQNPISVWANNYTLVWHFSDASGTKVTDSLLKTNGTFVNTPVWYYGTVGEGLKFTGSSSQGVSFASGSYCSYGFNCSTYTVETIMNRTASCDGVWECDVVSNVAGGGGVGNDFRGSYDTGNANKFFTSWSGGGQLGTSAVPTNTMNYLAFVYSDSLNNMDYYMNTTNDYHNAGSFTMDYGVPTATTCVGGLGSCSNYFLTAWIDEVRISNISRTANWLGASYYSSYGQLGTLGSMTGNVNQTSIALTINGASANASHSYTPSTADNFTAIINTTGLWVALYRNGTLLGNQTTGVTSSSVTPVGFWNITGYYAGNNSFGGSSSTWWLNVTQYVSACNLSFTPASPTVYPNQTKALCFCNNPEGTVNLFRNETNKNAENNTLVSLNVATHSYICNVTSSANYTSATNSSNYVVNIGSPIMNITFNTTNPVTQGTPVLVTCNKPTEISVTLYNDSTSVTNPYTLDTSTAGTYNFTCNTTGNANYSSGTTNNSILSTLLGGLYVTVYDEQSLSGITFNITAFNSTLSNTKYNQVSYQNTSLTGYVTVYYWANGYPQRNRYGYVPTSNTTTFVAYSLLSTSGQYVSFYILGYQGQPIVNALVQAQELLNSSYQVVDEEYTDSSGIATLFLNYNQLHYISIQYGGTWYLTNSSLIPSQTLYRYYINPFTASNTSTPFTNMNVTILPSSISLPMSTQSQAFSCIVLSSDSTLNWYGLNITLPNGTSTQTNYTSLTGGTVAKTFNLTNLYLTNQTYLDYDCFFSRSNFTQVDLVLRYYIYNDTSLGSSGLEKSFAEAQGLGYGVLALGIISLVISGLVGGFMGRFNSLAGGLTCILLLGFMWYYLGLFTILPFQIGGIYLLICLTTVSVIYLRGGI